MAAIVTEKVKRTGRQAEENEKSWAAEDEHGWHSGQAMALLIGRLTKALAPVALGRAAPQR